MCKERAQRLIMFILLFFIISCCHAEKPTDTLNLPILFPNDRPHQPDSYLCTSVSLSSHNSSLYIKAFTPIADMSVVHHMLLYGCIKPGSTKERMWNCGGMHSGSPKGQLPVAGVCSEGSLRYLYAWARNAPKLVLPENVAFQIGGNTGIQSLVLQFHNGNQQHHHHQSILGVQDSPNRKGQKNDTDTVGVILHVSHSPSPKLAGVYLLGSSGAIPPHRTVHLEIACLLGEHKEIHPFAFRTHSHSLGKVISGYRVRRVGTQFEWTLIGKKDPQLPQMFYPVENDKLVVKEGDILAARCTMQSNRTRMTFIGATAADEMCNFYIMYYVNEGNPLENGQCYNVGSFTEDFWSKSPFNFNNLPRDASVLL